MKWNFELRKMIYERMLREFGPYRHWTGATTPTGKGSSKILKAVHADLAIGFSKLTGYECSSGAVDMQFEWGTANQDKVVSKGHMYNFIMNKAAAMEVGFINSGDLPDFILMNKEY